MDEQQQQPLEPRVTAIVVSFNCAAGLRRTLLALEHSQERETIEVIVVDNGSRDDTAGIDADFPQVTFLRLPRNFGRAKAANIAMRGSHAEYLLFLAPGVVLAPDGIRQLAAALDAERDIVAVGPLLVDEHGSPQKSVRALPTPSTIGRAAWSEAGWPALPVETSAPIVPIAFIDLRAVLVRKFFLKGLNYFDERYGEHWLDAELSTQIRRVGRKAALLPPVTAACHPCAADPPMPSSARAALAADRALGAAVYAGKHYGFFAGLQLRIGLVFGSLGRALLSLLTFRDTGFEFSRFFDIAGGQKIDGSQGSI